MNDDAKKWIFQKNQIRNLGREIDKETQKLFWHKAITQRDGDGIEIALEKNFDFSLVSEDDLLGLAKSYNSYWKLEREGLIGIFHQIVDRLNLGPDQKVISFIEFLNSRIDNFLDYPVKGKAFIKYLNSIDSCLNFPDISTCRFIDKIFTNFATDVFNKVASSNYEGDLVYATQLSVLNKCDQNDLEIAFKNGITLNTKFYRDMDLLDLIEEAIIFWNKFNTSTNVEKCSRLKEFVTAQINDFTTYDKFFNETQSITSAEDDLNDLKSELIIFLEQNYDVFENLYILEASKNEVKDEL